MDTMDRVAVAAIAATATLSMVSIQPD